VAGDELPTPPRTVTPVSLTQPSGSSGFSDGWVSETGQAGVSRRTGAPARQAAIDSTARPNQSR